MSRNTLIGLVVVVLGLVYYFGFPQKKDTKTTVSNPLNTIYSIEGQGVELIAGRSETQLIPGSEIKVITKYFGDEIKYDFNSDGRQDVAFLLTQQTGGSGTYYYLVSSLNTDAGYKGSTGFFLGDRISPQTVGVGSNGVVVINYAERLIGQNYASNPSVSKSIWLKFDPSEMKFNEVPKPSSGGTNPASLTLNSQKWNWKSTSYGNGQTIYPNNKNAFVLIFKDSVTFSATTDCNGVGGEYSVSGNKITFSKMISTEMFCQDSQEQDFVKTLEGVDSYHFGSNGELIFDLKYDSGIAVFD